MGAVWHSLHKKKNGGIALTGKFLKPVRLYHSPAPQVHCCAAHLRYIAAGRADQGCPRPGQGHPRRWQRVFEMGGRLWTHPQILEAQTIRPDVRCLCKP